MDDQKHRILDKSQYSSKTLEIYEIVTAYFVDIFYNYLYFEAKKLKNDKKVNSLTDGYKNTVSAYLLAINDPTLYKKTMHNLHTFFVDSGFSCLTFNECIGKIVSEFVPSDYYQNLTKEKRKKMLRKILYNVVHKFADKIRKEFIIMIIDNHTDRDNPRLLQNEFIDLLILEREIVYDMFINKTTGGEVARLITLINSMKKDMKSLITENHELKKMQINLKKIIRGKHNEITELKARIEAATAVPPPRQWTPALESELQEEESSAFIEEILDNPVEIQSDETPMFELFEQVAPENNSGGPEPNEPIISPNHTLDFDEADLWISN